MRVLDWVDQLPMGVVVTPDSDHSNATESSAMEFGPHSNGPAQEDDLLDGFYIAGGMIAGSLPQRHRSSLHRIAMETMIDMRVFAAGTPAGEALFLGIIDGLDELAGLERALDEVA